MNRILLCTGVLQRDGAMLLVASQYPNQPHPLWGLPGGRPRESETLGDALRREFLEEAALAVDVGELLYVSESYDRSTATRVINVTFAVSSDAEPRHSSDDPHVVDLAWVPLDELDQRIAVAVVRIPLVAHVRGERRSYYAFADAGITIAFADQP